MPWPRACVGAGRGAPATGGAEQRPGGPKLAGAATAGAGGSVHEEGGVGRGGEGIKGVAKYKNGEDGYERERRYMRG